MGLVKQYDQQDERSFYEMPLVNYNNDNAYNKENLNYQNGVYEQSNSNQLFDGSEEIDVSNEAVRRSAPDTNLNSKQDSQGVNQQRLSYVWVEAFLCAMILLGILIIQNVKNTEGLQLNLREEIRHNLTGEEIISAWNYAEGLMQEYQHVIP